MQVPGYVAYYRVSTKGQGESGLGLEAQQQAVESFVERTGGQILRSFTEIESGRKGSQDRPQLKAALAYAKRATAVLCVAKLDRLSRNVAFLSGLMESGADFVACDNPFANRLTVHILAAVAEWERDMISKRTKIALEQAKARGVKLGSARPRHWKGRETLRLTGLEKARRKAAILATARAREDYADLLPEIIQMRNAGYSLRQVAHTLNNNGHQTRRGLNFHASQVRNILLREGHITE